MKDTAGEAKTNSYMMFSYRPLHAYVPVLADQQEIQDIGRNPEDLSEAMNDWD